MKTEVLTARPYSLRNIFGLSRRHHKDDVFGWFLESLQQGVEGGIRNLVCLIEDVNLIFVARRSIAGGVSQFADLIDTPVSGSVDLDDVHGVAGSDLCT